MKQTKLSPSRLNLLENCPRCFYLAVVKGKARPSGPFPSLPSGIDRILKEHFDKFREKGELPPELTNHNTGAHLFINDELMKVWRNNFRGIQWEDPESGILLRGAIDDMLEKDGKLIVLDYKTRGFPLKEDTAHHYQDQLNMYNFLLRKNGYETEDYAYLLFFMPESVTENGKFLFNAELVKMEINIQHAEDLFKKAVQVLQGEEPPINEECGFCKW